MSLKKYILVPVLLIMAVLPPLYAQSDRTGEEINWRVVTGGGEKGHSTSYLLHGSVGQTAADKGTSGSIVLHHGYYHDLPGSFTCDCIPGEIDGTPPINILDIIYVIDYKFEGGPPPVPYVTCSGDVTCDCIVNILDIIYLIDYKFKSGPAPCTCADWVSSCGTPITN